MSQMPKEGAFLAIYEGKGADTFRWVEDNQLEKFVYLGQGKHEGQVVSEDEWRELTSNSNTEFRAH